MNATTVSGSAAQQQLDAVLTQLAERVQRRVPGVKCRIHHGANDHFAWWVVARYSNSADEGKIVDVSVECRSAGPTFTLQADLAREDGTVLQEFPGNDAAVLPGIGATGLALEEALQGVTSFLLQQADCLGAELARGK